MAVAVGAGLIGSAVAGVFTSGVATAVAVGLGTAALAAGVKELIPDVPASASSNQELTIGKPEPRMVVGETVISGGIIKYEKVKQGKREWQHFYMALVPHKCESVVLYQVDGKRTSAMSGEGYYLEARLGNQTGPTARSLSLMSNVDSTFIGTNATDVYCEFVINEKIWPNGVQDLKFKVRGIKVYDPRKDDTVGGSGTHRLNDETTWEWSDNAALINFWWKKFKGAVVLDDDLFDLANIAAEANICDELQAVTDSQGNTTQEKRYTCNGVFNLSSGHEAVENQLLTSCAGKWIESTGGKYRLQVAAYRGPAIFTITENHLARAPYREPFTSLSSKFNIVNGSFIDKNAFYQDADITPIRSQDMIDNRDAGVEYEDDNPLLFTQTESMAQRLGVIKLLRNAAGDSIKLVLKRCYANFVAGAVVYLNMPEHLLVGNYEIEKSLLDERNGQVELEIKETSADMYNQAQTAPDFDATPNFQIDNTVIDAPNNIIFTQTESDNWRAGFLVVEHDVEESVIEWEITLASDDGQTRYSPIHYSRSGFFNLPGLSIGSYGVFARVKNSFGKWSEEYFDSFAISEVYYPPSATYTWIKYADDASGSGISNDPTGKAYIGFAYNKTTATESNAPADYTWSLIQGPQGNTGVAGAPGADGQTTYTWIKYSANADGTGLTDTPQSNTQYIGIAVNKTTASESTNKADYVWSRFKGDQGVQGEQGPQGVPGAPGADGQTTYTWIKYADNASGSGISNDPTGKAYIGFAYNKTTATESNAPADYTWSLIQGPQGNTGVAGAPGADGQTTYTWIKYSANADGTGLTDTPQSNTQYIGIAVNKTTASESTNKADYVWSRFKGEQGQQGPQGVPGAPGADGQTTYTWIKYADNASGSGISNDPTGKTYIGFAYNKTTATESNTASDYTWSLIQGPQGNTGVAGAPGADGQTTYTWIKYSANPDGTGLTDTPQSNTQYIGIAVNKTTASESTNKADYVWSRFKGEQGQQGPQGVPGAPGADGQTTYTWIKYADNASGSGISNDPTGKTYIGFAYNKTTATESNTASDYTWSLIQGPQGNTGVAGAPGADGQTTYTWIKYSANPDGTSLTDTPQSNTQYIGIAVNKTTASESTNKADYVWSRFKGDQGEQGPQGVPGAPGTNGQTTYTWIKYANNASGSGISNDPTGKTYIGFAYNKTTATESNTASDYTWSLIQGPQGNTGVAGAPGADGQTTYTWIKYSANPDGTSLTDTPQSNTQYIGIAVNKTTASESTNKADYVWSRFKGDQGITADAIVGRPGQQWGFKNDLEGWTLRNGDATYPNGKVRFVGTANDVGMVSPTLTALSGGDNYAIRVRIRTVSADHNTSAELYYSTGTHGYTGSYYKSIPVSFRQDEWIYLVFDMRELTAGGSDFIDKNITSIRVDFSNLGNGNIYEIDGVVIGYFGAADETDYTDNRISNDEITQLQIQYGAGWASMPVSGATRNTGALADRNNIDLANPGSFLLNRLGINLSNLETLNNRFVFGTDGYLTYTDNNGNPVNVGNVTADGLGVKTYRVIAKGASAGATPSGPGMYKNGSLVSSNTRSYVVNVISRTTGNYTSRTVFDVYASAANAQAMANYLNGLDSDVIVAIVSQDEPRGNRLANGLAAAMYRCGASRAVFGSNQFKFRAAYALIGIPGCGEGNGAEFYQGEVDQDTNAWLDAGFQVMNGSITGVSGSYTPKTLADYGFTGDLDANKVTDTNQLTDGAGLGNTATWSGVSGAGKPSNNANKTEVITDNVEGRASLRLDGATKYIDVFSSGERTKLDNLRANKDATGSYSQYHTGNKPTKSDVGLSHVDNKSSITIRGEAVSDALANALLRNPSGEGVNFLPAQYADPRNGIPIYRAGLHSDYIRENSSGIQEACPVSEGFYRWHATVNDSWGVFGPSSTNYNMPILPGRKWIVSAYFYRFTAVGTWGTHKIQCYLRTASGWYNGLTPSGASQETDWPWEKWTRKSWLVDLTGDTNIEALLRFDMDVANTAFYIAGIMVEPLKSGDNSQTPSPFVLPPRQAPILNAGSTMPMASLAGATATIASISGGSKVLDTEVNGNNANILIRNHTIQLPDKTISYNADTLTVAQGVRHYVYCDDPYGVGGSQSYVAVTAAQFSSVSAVSGRRWLGSITTASSGNPGGGDPDDDLCVSADMYLTDSLIAGNVQFGDALDVWNRERGFYTETVHYCLAGKTECVRLITSGGAVVVSTTTPIDLQDGRTIHAINALGELLLTQDKQGNQRWLPCIDMHFLAAQRVIKINVGDASYLAGETPDFRIVTHNWTEKP